MCFFGDIDVFLFSCHCEVEVKNNVEYFRGVLFCSFCVRVVIFVRLVILHNKCCKI